MGRFQQFQSFVKLLLMRLELYGQLVSVEWQEEKRRLQQLAFFIVLGAMCLSTFFIFFGVLLITLTWDTDYRFFTITVVTGLYGLGAVACFYLAGKKLGNVYQGFSATRMEILSDIQVIRSQL